ncbi:MAG: methyltransferase, partial [Nitratireductor sp.]
MIKPEQNQFLQLCKEALLNENFKRVVFATPLKGNGKKDDKLKTNFELVLGGNKKLIEISDNRGAAQTSDLNIEKLLEHFKGEGIMPFRAATLCTSECDWVYSQNRKGEARIAKAKASMKGAIKTHNRQKNYVLDEKRPYLTGLGITSASGNVIKKQYAKFRQIANFVEIIDRDIAEFVTQKDTPITMLDLGCGKGYLTFATYDYVRQRAKVEPIAIGIDIKANV